MEKVSIHMLLGHGEERETERGNMATESQISLRLSMEIIMYLSKLFYQEVLQAF